MRKELRKINGLRKTFTGKFHGYGIRQYLDFLVEGTILLIDVKDETGKIVSGHLWFYETKGFDNLGNINIGDTIKFDATARKYYNSIGRLDYKLIYPTNLEII